MDGLSPFSFGSTRSKVRRINWAELPLGCVIIDWPRVHGASIPELMTYPVITQELRGNLSRRYQFLNSTQVTIADPSVELESTWVQGLARSATRIIQGAQVLGQIKRNEWARLTCEPDARSGLASLVSYESSPYTLVKSWMRSISSCVRKRDDFGAAMWGPDLGEQAMGGVLGKLIAGAIKPLPDGTTLVDLGLDVSRSMICTGKAQACYSKLLTLIWPLMHTLGTSTWRFWLLSETCTAVNLSRMDPKNPPSLESLMEASRIESRETLFAPFVRQALNPADEYSRHLVLLITDGECGDRPETLRLLERLGKRGMEYLQLILHQDEESREVVEDQKGRGVDGFVMDEELSEGARIVQRSDQELQEYCRDELRKVTDLAEAAQGGQLILTWYPLFSYVSMDVYEQWLGSVLA